ncbi:MAG TPA: hypothetical protein VIX80_01555 [Candidatus Kapabacteria bacterium]
MRYIPFIVGLFLLYGSLNSCSEDPVKPCDTCKTPCDTCAPCDTCDTTKPTPSDTTSHDFIWTEYTIPTEVNLTGVYVHSDTEIFVIGSYMHRFDGKVWSRIDVRQEGTGRQLAFPDWTMFGLGSSDMWIVHGGIVDHYIGNSKAVEYREFGYTTACWGTSSSDMFFVGLNGMIVHFDGTKFTKMTSPTTKNLRSVWGISHNDVWASDANLSTGETTILHYDGMSWKEDELALTGSARTSGLSATWSCDSAGSKFVTTSGAHVYRKTDNGLWRNDSTLVPNDLGGGTFVGIYLLSGNNANDFVGSGSWGWVGHWNGKSWKRYDELYNYSILNYTSGGLSMKGNTICVVGLKSGKSWIAIGRRK